jgi:hypothetical protein
MIRLSPFKRAVIYSLLPDEAMTGESLEFNLLGKSVELKAITRLPPSARQRIEAYNHKYQIHKAH